MRRSVELYATLLLEGRRKPWKISYVFKYKISITLLLFLMSWKELPQSGYKSIKNP